MVIFFSEQPTFGLFPLAPPIICRSVGNLYSPGMTRDKWIQYCAKIWVDVFNLSGSTLTMNQGNWIPNGENRGEFFELVRAEAGRLYREQNQQ